MNHSNGQKNNKNQKGFTLIETLVAIFILLISTTGPLTFAQSGLRASFLARDQIGAFYLAQDVIETIKNLRDNTGLSGASSDWLGGIPLECRPESVGVTKVCNMDTAQSGVFNTIACDFEEGCTTPLYYENASRQFVVASGPSSGLTASKYTRTIYLIELEDNREMQIVVEVKWESNFFSEKRIVVQENIYNWVPALN